MNSKLLHQSFGMTYSKPVNQCLQIHSEAAVHRIREIGGIRPDYCFLCVNDCYAAT